jgi:hypothetical protein
MSAESVESEGPARAFFSDRYTWLRSELSKDVSSRQEAGEVAADLDPDDVASLLIAVADGLQLQWLLDPGKVQMARLLSSFWETLKRVESPVEAASQG